MDITVVGAGLGGLAAALALHRTGHAVRVLERAPELRETGAGIGIMPNGVLALDVLGLGGPVRAQAAPLGPAGGVRDRHGRLLLATDQAAIQALTGAPLVVVPRRWLHGLLVDALPAGTGPHRAVGRGDPGGRRRGRRRRGGEPPAGGAVPRPSRAERFGRVRRAGDRPGPGGGAPGPVSSCARPAA